MPLWATANDETVFRLRPRSWDTLDSRNSDLELGEEKTRRIFFGGFAGVTCLRHGVGKGSLGAGLDYGKVAPATRAHALRRSEAGMRHLSLREQSRPLLNLFDNVPFPPH
jgi:hypothetical protein